MKKEYKCPYYPIVKCKKIDRDCEDCPWGPGGIIPQIVDKSKMIATPLDDKG